MGTRSHRNMPRFVFLVLVCVVAMAHIARGATYYVDFEGGTDANDGLSIQAAFQHSPGDPEATGNAKQAVLQPGDSVIFKGGVVYRGALQVKWSGEEGRGIVYDGNTAGTFGQGRAILDGSEPVTDWQRCTSAEQCGRNPHYASIYRAYVPAGPKGLNALAAGIVQDDRMLYPAQYPNPVDPFYADDRRFFLSRQTGVAETSISDPRLAEMGGEALAGGYVYLDIAGNLVDYQPITGYDAATTTITFQKPRNRPLAKYAVANCLSGTVLDRPGEYVFTDEPDAEGRHAVYIWPWDDRDPNESLVTCTVRPLGIDLGRGHHYVTIQGFVIRNYHTALVAHQCNGLTLRDNEITQIRQTGRGTAVSVTNTEEFLFVGNNLHHTPKTHGVITHTGQNVVYSGNRVHMVGLSPLIFYRITRGQIIDNKVTDCTGVHSNAFSIYVDDRDILIARNEVHNSKLALTVQNSENVYVLNNIFTNPSGSVVGLWPGRPHKGLFFLNNVIYSPGYAIYANTTAIQDSVFVNNIMGGPTGYPISRENTFTHNIYTQPRRGLGEGEMMALEVEGVFRDADERDFRPAALSPAIDMGADIRAYLPRETFPDFDFDVDFAGQVRPYGPRWDIGPYEAEYAEGALDNRPPLLTGSAAEPVERREDFRRIPGREPIVLAGPAFTGEGGGKVEVADPESTARIDYFLRWDAEGHWLEWPVETPQAGQYEVTLRYATAFPAPRRLDVNGAAVPGLESFTLEPTGGWSHWLEQKLPVPVTLKAGRNMLRLTSLGGRGCNLDLITLTAPGRDDIVVTAGAFTGQEGGKVEVRPGVKHGYFYMWNAAGHWLEWTVENARAGRYEIVLRYATLAQSPRELSVNGRVVEGLQSFTLDRTEGWTHWQEASLPVAVTLREGRNVLRFNSLGGAGLNFDEMRLIPVE